MSRHDSSIKQSLQEIETTPKNFENIIEMIEQKLSVNGLKVLPNVGIPHDSKPTYLENGGKNKKLMYFYQYFIKKLEPIMNDSNKNNTGFRLSSVVDEEFYRNNQHYS